LRRTVDALAAEHVVHDVQHIDVVVNAEDSPQSALPHVVVCLGRRLSGRAPLQCNSYTTRSPT